MKEYDKWLALPNPSVLYHYTNAESFLGIIQKKCFWASNIFFQNDKSEIEFSIDLLIEEMRQLETLYTELKHCNDKLTKILRIENMYNCEDIYTVSFSEKRDDLGQFRGYGNNSVGFSIGFDTYKFIDSIEKQSKNNTETAPKFVFNLIKCLYDKNKQKEIIREIIEDVINGKKYSDPTQLFIDIIAHMVLFAPVFKSDAFREEEEWRLIIRNVNDNTNIKERVGKSYFIPYYNLIFKNQECFGDFVIGPCADEKIVKYSVEKLCLNNEIDLNNRKVNSSNIPFRNW